MLIEFFLILKLGMLQSPLFDLFNLLLCLSLLLDLGSIIFGVPLLLLTMVLLQIFFVFTLSLDEFLLLLDELVADAFFSLLGNFSLRLRSVVFFQDGILVKSSPLVDFRLKATDDA